MNVFLCEPIHHIAYKSLSQHVHIIHNIEDIQTCEIIITRNMKVDQSLIKKCPLLKLVVVHGSGYNDVDVNYCRKNNILVANTPGENALSVSELIITLMLNLSRHTQQLHNDYIDNKIHTVAPLQYMGNEISYKTFGMIGVGDIALKTARILRDGFHMNIIGCSRSLNPHKAKELDIGYCANIEDVMRQSDFVSIGVSLNEDTYHMIGKKELSYMKDSAYLINTSRGAIIDEEALYDALVTHKIAGAGLDVLENEPVVSTHPLLQLDNVIYTPHMGASTDEALYRVGMNVVKIIIDYINTKTCNYMI